LSNQLLFSVVWYYDIVIVIVMAITVTVYLVKDVVKLFFFYCYRSMVNKAYQIVWQTDRQTDRQT